MTRGEIRDALASPIPPVDLDGLRRRTRAHMGRCQGFFCGAQLEALLAEARAMADGPVAIVGGGPAGLAAAVELRRRGVREVVVLEREAEAGGIPRHAQPPGLRAARPAPPAERAGLRAPLRASSRARPGPSCSTETMVTGWAAGRARSS